MGIVREQIEHDETGAIITVVERQEGEYRAPWQMIDVELDSMDRMTPPEMRRLGRWLQKEGKRIGREFKSNGAPRA